MSYLLFMDESGHDRGDAPYEVLAGICIQDRDLWPLINAIHRAEEEFFGQRITTGAMELKAKKLLKKKTFKHASQLPAIDPLERTTNARACLLKGASSKGQKQNDVTRIELTGLAQAKLAFVKRLLDMCIEYRVKAFASIIDKDAPCSSRDFLRKDYSYLFERYFNFLDTLMPNEMGIVVFDELERSLCHMLVDQMYRYFRETSKGQRRASRIIPEPFFVHSDLTTAIQMADIVAYIISWGVRLNNMNRPPRGELNVLADLVLQLRNQSPVIGNDGIQYPQWSFVLIDDLRPRAEREEV